MSNRKTYTYENEIAFHNALAELDNIVDCHFHYEYNRGYMLWKKSKMMKSDGMHI